VDVSSDFGLILIVLAALAVAGACGFLAFHYRRRSIEAARAAARAAEAQAVLAVAPVGCFTSARDAGPAHCSSWLK